MPQQQQGSSMSETKSRTSQRFHSLNAEQVEVLHHVLSEAVPIHGRGNFPTLELRPRDIIIAVRARLQKQGITVRDVRLNGSTASHVLVQDNGSGYKDLDIIFGVELPSQEEFQVIKESVLSCLLDCLPAAVNRERISSATMKEAYVQKMVKVFSEYDRWSLISLSNNSGKNLELKFVSVLRRQFEFSVDSFQIILDPLLESYMQQELQHKSNVIDQKDQFAGDEHKDSMLSQTSAPETEDVNGKDLSGKEEALISQTQQREEDHGKESNPSQQIKETNKTTLPKFETNQQEKTPVELKEESPQTDNVTLTDVSNQVPLRTSSEMGKTSVETEQPTQIEIRQEPELLGEAKCSAKVVQAEETKVDDGQQLVQCSQTEICSPPEKTEKTMPVLEQSELKQRMQQSELPETSNKSQTELLKLSEEWIGTDPSKYFSVDQGGDEKDKTQHVSLSDAKTEEQSADENKVETEAEEKSEREEDTEIDKEKKEIRASEAKNIEDTQGIDCSSSPSPISLSFDNVQSACTQDTLDITSTYHSDNLEKTHNSLDALSPPDTQDVSPAPPSLVSDKKTSSPTSCKASERLSHMVVLKHSSPKPPRRMCRKIAPNSSPSPAPERAPATAPCVRPGLSLSPSPEPQMLPDPEQKSPTSDPTSSPAISAASTPNSGPESELSNDINPHLELTSAPDTIPDLSVLPSAVDPPFTLPQKPSTPPLTAESIGGQIIHNSHEAHSDCDDKMQSADSETVVASGQSDLTNSEEVSVSHADTARPNTQEPEHTSDVELSDGQENREDWTTELNLDQPQDDDSMRTASSSPSPSQCVTPPASCLTPPVLSLSAPCFTPSPPGLSPLQCLTPSSYSFSSPGSSNVSPVANFNSPPPSCSPTSSGLCSPPYLTPPMLSLSPPPLCPSPPSPSLSPPLLCLTPPMESEDLVPQVSSDIEPLILNTDGKNHFSESSPQPVEDLQPDETNISSLPQVAEPVSFLITIPSATSHSLPAPQCKSPGDSAPPKADEVSCSVPENKEVPEVASDMPEQSNNPQASGSVLAVEVLAESMYGDFEAAMDHLRYRLIATRNPEEIRGGGLLKYSNLLVRDYRPASETQIKTLERYMCSRFFIDFPDVQEQQRKILSYLKNHFIGEERSKYQYLMTLRRVVDDSTVCLMGHERRQTLNMITVLALKVLGEQNIIPNTDHVTCFYQPAPYLAEHTAPYLAEPSYCSYYIPQGGSTLLYQPYPLHLHTQTGLV
ncbi:uncharacterized protein tent5d [Nelusetta ayraudi]|uniref:uncharacterized protein tent5d n=1 Tax=Nelusetta ayraudi TaxID=303726 RepID=UPI003F6F8B40